MASLLTAAAMGADEALRPRVAAAVIRLAIRVISTPIPNDLEAQPLERSVALQRRAYALNVTEDVAAFTQRAQYALACAENSPLADIYEQGGGADAITDEQLMGTLAAVWEATGGA